MTNSLATVRKFLAALTAVLGVAIANNMVHGTALRWTNFIIAAVAAVVVYLVPNEDTPPADV